MCDGETEAQRGVETWRRSRSQSLCENKNPGPPPSRPPRRPSGPFLRTACFLPGWGLPVALGSWFAFEVGVAGLGPTSRPGCSGYPRLALPPRSVLHLPQSHLRPRGAGGRGGPQISPITEALKIASCPGQRGLRGAQLVCPVPRSKVPWSMSHWNNCGRAWTGALGAAQPADLWRQGGDRGAHLLPVRPSHPDCLPCAWMPLDVPDPETGATCPGAHSQSAEQAQSPGPLAGGPGTGSRQRPGHCPVEGMPGGGVDAGLWLPPSLVSTVL